ncbi:hypothetical protein FKM82_028981 [Ascaphus truei]
MSHTVSPLSSLCRSRTLFIRCLSPNSKQVPGIFDVEFVSSQLRNSGTLEAVQLIKEGYPVRVPLPEFVNRYGHLAGKGVSFTDERETCCAVLAKAIGDPSTLYQIGASKVRAHAGESSSLIVRLLPGYTRRMELSLVQ